MTMNQTTMTGPNSWPMRRGPASLNHEQADQDRERERHDENVECRRDELEAFHRRKHRDRRRDDAVAIEQRRAHDRRAGPEAGVRGPLAMRSAATSDSSARMPPSPSLSARRTKTTYFSDTITISAQKISETMPRTSAAIGGVWPVADSARPRRRRAGSCRYRRTRRRARSVPGTSRSLYGPVGRCWTVRALSGSTVAALRSDGASISVHSADRARNRRVAPGCPAGFKVPTSAGVMAGDEGSQAATCLDCGLCTRPISDDFTMNSRPRALASPWFAWNLCG